MNPYHNFPTQVWDFKIWKQHVGKMYVKHWQSCLLWSHKYSREY